MGEGGPLFCSVLSLFDFQSFRRHQSSRCQARESSARSTPRGYPFPHHCDCTWALEAAGVTMAPDVTNSPSSSGQIVTDNSRGLTDTVKRDTSSALLDGETFERRVGLAVVVAVLFLDSVLLSCIVPIVPHYLGEKIGESFFCCCCCAHARLGHFSAFPQFVPALTGQDTHTLERGNKTTTRLRCPDAHTHIQYCYKSSFHAEG